MTIYSRFFKIIFDFLVSIFLLILLTPIILVVTIWLFLVNGGKPFFYQLRPGKNARIFKLIKFKTMTDKTDSHGNLLTDSERLTSPGRLIRNLSLDELPQLLNVVKGDMSLVGPRPLLIEYLPLYNDRHKRRHEVKPGITGWAQVNGRNAISWEEKFDFDIWYVDNISFLIDLKILWITFLKVLKKEGINQKTDIPMEKFKGSE
ncbi:MAG: sugar transferase [Cyclobacteriaceae bacterium]